MRLSANPFDRRNRVMRMFVIGALFILLLIAFVAFAVWYLIANDFAKETMEVVFPAIGAILFSFYLAFKAIWVDAPSPRVFGGPVAVVRTQTGQLHGVPRPNVNLAPSFDEFRGALAIETMLIQPRFRPLNLQQQVVQSQPGMPDDPVFHVVEYAVLDWLSKPDLAVGATVTPVYKLVSGGGGAVGVSTKLMPVTATREGMGANPLLAAQPVTIRLPASSSISRAASKPLSFEVRTRYSTLTVSQQGVSCELLAAPVSAEAAKIQAAVSPHPNALAGNLLCAYGVKIQFAQRPFSRLSRQASLEAAWADRLQLQFERDFSWNYFRGRALGLP